MTTKETNGAIGSIVVAANLMEDEDFFDESGKANNALKDFIKELLIQAFGVSLDETNKLDPEVKEALVERLRVTFDGITKTMVKAIEEAF